MDRIVAIDSGLTVTKAVIFDLAGRELAVARRLVPQIQSRPRHVERDMTHLWKQTAQAIREVLSISHTDASRVVAVAATAHGDGLYLLDRSGNPLGHGILSLDSRAVNIIDNWQQQSVHAKALALTGQEPHVSAPSALLRWIRENEPDRYAHIGHVLSCKDWLTYCLTGHIGTDRTEASTSFCDVKTQAFSTQAFTLYGLSELEHTLPTVAHSAEQVGTITQEAAAATGLAPGTPVAAGLHDVTASSLGIGAHCPDVVGIVAGTYAINECVSASPQIGSGWFCRNAIDTGVWNNMAISPASTTNYNWFLDTLCSAEQVEQAKQAEQGADIHTLLSPEIDAALARPSSIIYHPYLYGSPMGPLPSACFLGLRGWHERGDLLAAVLEGIVFNHRQHIDTLRETFTCSSARLTGGASRNPAVAQLFADILNMPVTVTDTDEAAARGAALCAGAAVKVFKRFDNDPQDLLADACTYTPQPGRVTHYAQRYGAYREAGDALTGIWNKLDNLATINRQGDHG